MKKTIVWVFIVSAIYFTGCSSDMYNSAREYPENRFQNSDPFMSNQGFYGSRLGYGYNPFNPFGPQHYGYNPYDPYGYLPNAGYGRSYNPYNRRRPRVIVRSAPQPGTGVKIRPINPRTDRYNPRDRSRD